jgi:CRP-like cAMP-binding protein
MSESALVIPRPLPDDVNALLACCPPDVVLRWAPVLHPVTLEAGVRLYGSGSPITHVYFPLTAVIAVEHSREGDRAQTVAILGRDQLAGATVLLSADSGAERATVVIGGTALRLDAGALVAEWRSSSELADLMARYLQCFVTQVAQTAYCNRYHGLLDCLSLRLLQLIGTDDDVEFALPQVALGGLVGARRERINLLLGELRADDAVELRRGRIRLSRRGLLRHVCDCHGVLEAAQRRVCAAGRG